ncbi:cation transporter [Salinicoccus halitifaciens]|nr:cation transporter [Salinicoccus halitifaciens]MCD2137805.1 cation transporter [Salinicoccus halitifaciens]
MNCAHYVNKIEETLLSLQDVENARVNLKKGIARVKFDETVRASR